MSDKIQLIMNMLDKAPLSQKKTKKTDSEQLCVLLTVPELCRFSFLENFQCQSLLSNVSDTEPKLLR